MRPGDFGPVQRKLIDRAEKSGLSLIYVADYQEMRAARKLAARKVFVHLGAAGTPSRLFILQTALLEAIRNA